ncbi:ATP-binding protein [Thermodesulfobacteriota bacterium]
MDSIGKKSPRLVGEILNIVQDAVLLVNAEHRIFFANSKAAKMFKTSVAVLVENPFTQLFMPDDREIMSPNIEKLTETEGEYETELMLRRPDGSSFLGLMSCAFFRWEKEGCMAITIHDISKMKSIERLLKRMDHIAFLGHMLDDINHQIRNPVLVIGGLARRLAERESNKKYADAIVKESSQLENLLDTLNNFITLPRPKLRQTLLSDLVMALETRFRSVATEHGCQLVCSCSEEIQSQTILTDLHLLLVAISSIVINGCEAYGNDEGDKKVTITLAANDDPVWPITIKIIDQGEGISAEDLPYATSHFFTNKTKHTGMGLTFAERILNDQGGTLTIDSKKNHGTTVTIAMVRERRRIIRRARLF